MINPVLRQRGRKRNRALSPDPLLPKASFIQLRAKQIEESQFPAQVRSQKGALLVKPADW